MSFEKQNLTMIVDLDERGVFKAHVEDQSGVEVFSFSNEDEDGNTGSLWIVEDGFMRHARDIDGLHGYLIDLGIAKSDSTLSLDE